MLICIPKTKEYRTKTKEYKASSFTTFRLRSFVVLYYLIQKKQKGNTFLRK
jgi:hypothetical protein